MKPLDHVPPQLPVGGRCKIAFVGMAPSDYERLYGFPLVGPAGRIFDQELRIAGLAVEGGFEAPPRARNVRRMLEVRAPYLVTNVFDEQLPNNDIRRGARLQQKGLAGMTIIDWIGLVGLGIFILGLYLTLTDSDRS